MKDKIGNLLERARRQFKPHPMCRDCADYDGRCPHTGELCDPSACADEIVDGLEQEITRLRKELAEAIEKAHMAGQHSAGVDPSYSEARAYRIKQEPTHDKD